MPWECRDSRVVTGPAPEALAGLPVPDAIFVGGGATVPDVIERCWAALAPAGRLVVHAVTLETEAILFDRYKSLGGELVRLSNEHAAPIGTFTGWTPARTVTQWAITKREIELTIHFIGAGPGAADLLTLRAVALLNSSTVCLYAGTYITAEVLGHCPADAELIDTQHLNLDEITATWWTPTSAAWMWLDSAPEIRRSIRRWPSRPGGSTVRASPGMSPQGCPPTRLPQRFSAASSPLPS